MDGRKLLKLRKKQGFSRYKLAQKVGVDPMTIFHYERGTFKPRPEKFQALVSALGCSASDLK